MTSSRVLMDLSQADPKVREHSYLNVFLFGQTTRQDDLIKNGGMRI
jgi:hypothetical protein